MNLLEISNLSVTYGDKFILTNASIAVNKGEIIGIFGDSGCGKTTLLKSIVGILPPTMVRKSGSIVYNGKDITALSPLDLRKTRGKDIGFVFQNSENSFCPVRTVESQLVELIRAHERVTKHSAKERIYEMFARMNFSDVKRVASSYPFELSGGMNQRVGIAAAMLLKPGLLLADEPTSALDEKLQKCIIDEMVDVCNDLNTTVILVSHNRSLLNDIAHRCFEVENGFVRNIIA